MHSFRLDYFWSKLHQQKGIEALPHVYTSSKISQGNVVSQYGSKYMLPLGTTREMFEVGCIAQAKSRYIADLLPLRRMKRLLFLQQSQFRRSPQSVLLKYLSSMRFLREAFRYVMFSANAFGSLITCTPGLLYSQKDSVNRLSDSVCFNRESSHMRYWTFSFWLTSSETID